jgi:type 1 fimbria pilin
MLTASVLSSLLFGMGVAHADPVPNDQGHGTIKFVGAIIDAPCSLTPEAADQTVQLGQISANLLNKKGSSGLRPFEIALEGCSFETATTASVTFNGITNDVAKKQLTTQGDGKGAAIEMMSMLDGEPVVLGTPSQAGVLLEGNNKLKFAAKVVSIVNDGKTGESIKAATPGDFYATADFMLSYL